MISLDLVPQPWSPIVREPANGIRRERRDGTLLRLLILYIPTIRSNEPLAKPVVGL